MQKNLDKFFNQPTPVRKVERAIALSHLDWEFKRIYDSRKLKNRTDVWTVVAEHIGQDEPVSILEFGVYEGKSTKFWADHFRSAEMVYHGFDSFEGLPEDWTPQLKRGAFSTDGRTPDVDDPRVNFHKGWFQNVYPQFLDENANALGGTRLLHLDADLYSSTLFILTLSWKYFDEFYFLFDEFANHENRAFYNFLESFPCKVEFFAYSPNLHSLPAQVFGRLKRVGLEPGQSWF